MLVSKPTHGGGAPLGIDLEAGIAKITVRRPAADPQPEQAPADDPVLGTPDLVTDETADGS